MEAVVDQPEIRDICDLRDGVTVDQVCVVRDREIRQAAAVTGSSTSETGPTTASGTIASAAVLSPAAPLNRCSRTEPLASGERRLSCRSRSVISPPLRRDAMHGSNAPHGCASTARDDRAVAAIDRRHPGELLMRLPLAGWLENVDQGEASKSRNSWGRQGR